MDRIKSLESLQCQNRQEVPEEARLFQAEVFCQGEQEPGLPMLVRENKPIFKEKMEEYMTDPLVIYSKWAGYLKGKHANPQISEFIGNHRMEILHTSGHAYVETIEKLIRLTNPKTIIPMHTECADDFDEITAFAPYRDKVKVLQDREGYDF